MITYTSASRVRVPFACAIGAIAVSIVGAASAQAAVVISSKPTKNMSCSGGVCTPTKANAVLNVTDLANMLASGDVKVLSDRRSADIDVMASLSWTSTSRLTLDSYQSIIFEKPVTVAGTGALSVTTSDRGSYGDFWFVRKGHIEFWDLHSSLVVNGNSYKLVETVKQLAKAIAANTSGFYALAKNYDATNDGTYSQSPIAMTFSGTFEGLGNDISNVSVNDTTENESAGFFGGAFGSVRNFNLLHISISSRGSAGGLAAAGSNFVRCSVTGSVSGSNYTGGLVGDTAGGIQYSRAAVKVTSTSGPAGGLVGDLHGGDLSAISFSYATGAVSGGDDSAVGGLAGVTEVASAAIGIVWSYATGQVSGGANAYVGGFIGFEGGENLSAGSYSTGAVIGGTGSCVGGFIGITGSFEHGSDYWDVDTSGTDQGTCNGGTSGVSGLTTEQFKSGLPDGFDPNVWGQDPNINNGYPYLLANPPAK